MAEKFTVRYEASDGCVGKSRPQYFDIDPWEIEDDMSDGDLEMLYHQLVQDDFEQSVTAEGLNLDEFLEWARQVRGEED